MPFSVLLLWLLPAQSTPATVTAYTPLAAVRALTFYATPALYQQLADTGARPTQFIYPGGHAYVLGYVNKRWYVVSRTLADTARRYYLRRNGLREVAPYTPVKSDW